MSYKSDNDVLYSVYIQVGPCISQTENELGVTEEIRGGKEVAVQTESENLEESTLKPDANNNEEQRRCCTKKLLVKSTCGSVGIILIITFLGLSLRKAPSIRSYDCTGPKPHEPTICYDDNFHNPTRVPLQNITCHNNNDCRNLNCSSYNNNGNVYSGACFCRVSRESITTTASNSTSTTTSSSTTSATMKDSSTTTSTSLPSSTGSCTCMQEFRFCPT
eukprot:m.3824 g.3824  ORF g.3824 m.3824 type:complete len:219 (+) comp2837_c0_seq2:187-843(+)